ncbi:Flagellar biosynthetic protein FlhB [Hydrogenovibrio crunogenus]|uniref:Flagellar biosynthetic protein FlhB n=1 Tax=Hydrogenovibrio crunogenus TaxID=39765 RepID=A0A4V1C8Q3_9GAMM|nr:flagellar biosynthesis protein FlhB [Hydrogenovibrio crunogenus]QBZ82704.1 Flagellar biosynthetic protein FlhB [Hydrogenovibrio crunogenus]RUM90344.1 MAG: flagellar biosynthesis protein FlhB [Thiomicrospira sp.]
MAENEDGTEKSEEPSEKKLREAREKGQVPRSRELTTLLMTLGAAVFLYFFGAQMMQDFETLFVKGLSFDRSHAYDFEMATNLILGLVVHSIYMIVPFLLLMVLIAVVSPMLLGGWNFSTQALAPKISKLNPVSGIKKMFSMNALMELFKAFAKFTLVSVVAGFFLWYSYEEIISIGIEPPKQALAHAGQLIVEAFIFVSLSLIVIAAIDVPFQVHQHVTQLKMTKQEVKEEHKQQEGSPEVKGRIRQLQREMSQKRMMQKVPEADVVITNPTHFAVALKYAPDEMAEPMVLALGSDFMAAQIRTLAKEHNIPLIEAPPLARALYYNAEVDRPIPYELFRAVAAILAYVYQLRDGKRADRVDFDNLPIPEEMKTDEVPGGSE